MITGTKKAIIHFEQYNFKNPSLFTVVFLHGFSGSSNDWKQIIKMLPVKLQCVAIDLVGHGKSFSPDDINLYNKDAIVAQINSVLNKLKLGKIILVGYSMGGRAALSYALNNPLRVKGLVLESTTPGIIQESLRKERRNSDEEIAGLIENSGIENFVDYWMHLPIFETQKKLPVEKLKEVRLKKLNNNKTGLINSIRGFGQGVMPQAWNELIKIDFKVLLITGEKDLKYTVLNSQMLAKIKNAEHKIISDAGHNIHLEKPEVFVTLLKDFIMKF
jgi:2-succinyl-6-hydroxy-2,4-cyclohexadiene-1-carboxylate synthase